MVDGQDNAVSNIWDFKIYEVAKYITVTNYSTGPDPFIVNLSWYQNLPYDLKLIFNEVSRDTIALSDRMNRESEQNYIDQISAHLETNLVEGGALEPFRQAVQPVYDYFIDQGTFTQDDVNRARVAARGDS